MSYKLKANPAPRGLFDKVLQLRISQDMADRIDEWRRTAKPAPSVSQAIRQLIDAGLSEIEDDEFSMMDTEL